MRPWVFFIHAVAGMMFAIAMCGWYFTRLKIHRIEQRVRMLETLTNAAKLRELLSQHACSGKTNKSQSPVGELGAA